MSFNYGFAKETDLDYIEAAATVLEHAKLATLLLPGIGTVEDLREAYEAGAGQFAWRRIVPRPTSPNSTSNMPITGHGCRRFSDDGAYEPANKLAEQALLMEEYGAHCVYVRCGGALDARRRRPVQSVQRRAETGNQQVFTPTQSVLRHSEFHVALNTAVHGRCVSRRHGRGGRRTLEIFVAVADRMGLNHGCDLFELMDAAEELVRPLQDRPVQVDRETLSLGYAGFIRASAPR